MSPPGADRPATSLQAVSVAAPSRMSGGGRLSPANRSQPRGSRIAAEVLGPIRPLVPVARMPGRASYQAPPPVPSWIGHRAESAAPDEGNSRFTGP